MARVTSASDYLLDTSVLSEWVKPRPNLGVVRWLAEVDEDRVYLSVTSFAEIRHGIERMPASARRDRLAAWLDEDLPARFEGRIFDIDRGVAGTWGVIVASSEQAGYSPSTMDAFFAATARYYGLTLVTRNVKDFEKLGVPLLNPWTEPSD